MIRPRLSELKLSVRNLWQEFGRTDSLLVGVLVSVALALPGIAGYVLLSSPWNYVAAVWALLNLLPILQGVLRL